MKQIFIILTLFSSLVAFGQDRKVHFKTYENGDTTLWYKWRMELCAQLELDPIQNSKYNWHFRIWTNKQAIDLWEDSKEGKLGKLTSWTEEYVPGDEEPTNRVFFEVKLLDSNKVNELISLVESSKITDIPSEDSIEGWGQGYDGITYITETADTKDYFFKTYWTPTAQDSLKEAFIVQSFVDRCQVLSESKEIWSDFVSRIPYECYRNGGPRVSCKIVTKREHRKYKKERKKYRQQNLNSILR